MLPWQPVVDGDVIPAPPIDRIAAGAGADIDVMVGTNTDEWRLFLVPSGAIDQITAPDGPGRSRGGLRAPGAKRRWPPIARRIPAPAPATCSRPIQTDWCCRIPAIRLADAHAKSPAATYMYEFAWRSPAVRWTPRRVPRRSRSPSSSTRSARARPIGPLLGPTRRNSSPTRCTPPGLRSPPVETPVGRSTTSAAGPPCASIRVGGRGRSSIRGAGAVGRRALAEGWNMLKRFLLVCGVLSSLLYVVIDGVAALRYGDYHSYISQAISELGAVGAPTRPLVHPLFVAYGVLLIAFGVGVWTSAGRTRALRVIGTLLVGIAVVGLVTRHVPAWDGEHIGRPPAHHSHGCDRAVHPVCYRLWCFSLWKGVATTHLPPSRPCLEA